MDKKLMALNLMKTREVKKSKFKRNLFIFIGVFLTLAFLVYKFELMRFI